jgi:hypothetical protein
MVTFISVATVIGVVFAFVLWKLVTVKIPDDRDGPPTEPPNNGRDIER